MSTKKEQDFFFLVIQFRVLPKWSEDVSFLYSKSSQLGWGWALL